MIVDDQGRCLLLRRSAACRNFVGKWEWPGGKVDEGEAFDVALLREVREEAGLDIRPTGVVGAIGFEMAAVKVAVLCMEAELLGGEFALSEEHDDHAWVPVPQTVEWDLTDGLMPLAESLAARYGRGN